MNYATIHKENDMPSFMESSDKRLKVLFKNWAEPNNGRMLWQVDVFVANTLINDKIFSNDWNYINNEINRLQLNDLNNEFYYLPVEGKSKLINSKTNAIIDLPFYSASTVRFYGNKFQHNMLIEVYIDIIVLTSIIDFSFFSYKKDFDGYIIDAQLESENTLSIEYYLISNGKRTVHHKIVDSSDFKILEIDELKYR
jgi:hypothetical protein